ncbi:MAG: TetR/AcrR family transcriptional regulator [Proteobacteria bacterium]|nr:TetR/AcrR family transcriptional regulator [Pseudomonadota bacterium]MBU1417995.1 TetR/AcrR family transcriptional regulator [Pseudomonadota bacterium]MBU1454531.1 TetR/AcrR family transcriptional regulator [Pseudomonadota bacterium]
MARNKQFNDGEVLDIVLNLFWKKGYGATSIQDIEKATGLKRTSLYNAFGNKRSLFMKVLSTYSDNIKEMLIKTISESADCRAMTKDWLNKVIDFQFNDITPGGCLVIFSVLENEQHDQEVKKLAQSLFWQEKELIEQDFYRGIKEGELPPDFACQRMAGVITATASGLVILALAGFPEAMLRDQVETFLAMMDLQLRPSPCQN